MNEGDLDAGRYCKDAYRPDLNFNFSNCEQVMKDDEYNLKLINFSNTLFVV